MRIKQLTKASAMLLTIIMALSVVPNTALAEETMHVLPSEVVVYNIGDGEVSVGTEGMGTDHCFDEDGNFAIVLERNSIFPYEVEFQWGFERAVETFDTESSVVEIGGHVFSVVVPVGETPVALMMAAEDEGSITLRTESADGMLTREEVSTQLSAAGIGMHSIFFATIDSSVKGIDDLAFDYYLGLTRIYIPSSVTNIGASSFSATGSLKEIVFLPGTKIIPDHTFEGIPSHAAVFMPRSVEHISENSRLGINFTTKIYVFAGTYAEEYAKSISHRNPYQIMPTILSELPEAPEGFVNLPYSFKFESSNDAFLWVLEEDLPDGMKVSTVSNAKRDFGEIYGAPKEAGTFTVRVRASDGEYYPLVDEATFTIVIKGEQTQEELNALNDFAIINPLGVYEKAEEIYVVHEYDDEAYREVEIKFADRIEPNLDLCHPENFIDLWINGEQMEPEDYEVREGSVVITLRAQTFGNLDRESSHVIAAEFKNKDGEQYKVAQNFKFNVAERPPDPDTDGGNNNGGNSSSRQSSTPRVDTNIIVNDEPIPLATMLSEPEILSELAETFEPVVGNFIDVRSTDWFYGDVQWAYQNQVMIGVSATEFAPNMPSSPAMAALTLARMLDVDLSVYNREGGAWYSAAIAWAESIGIFDGIIGFSPNMEMERGQLMIVIERALRMAGVNAAVTNEFIIFPDADEMTDEELRVFQLFYDLGIVHGKSDGAMDPRGTSTRSELAAILHRIEEYVHESENDTGDSSY